MGYWDACRVGGINGGGGHTVGFPLDLGGGWEGEGTGNPKVLGGKGTSFWGWGGGATVGFPLGF